MPDSHTTSTDLEKQNREFRERIARLEREVRRLGRSKHFLESILENSHLLTLVVDSKGRILFCNSFLLELTGWQEKHVVGAYWPDLFDPGTPPDEPSVHWQLAGKSTPQHFISELLDRTGEQRIIDWGTAQLQDRDGQPLGVALIGEDITEAQRHDQNLQREIQVKESTAQLASALLSPLTIEETSSLVLEHACRLTGSTRAFIGYLDPQTGHLVCPRMPADIASDCSIPSQPIPPSEFKGFWGWVLRKRQSVLTNQPESDPRCCKHGSENCPFKRVLAVPALIADRLVGILFLADSSRDYDNQDLEIVKRFAVAVSLAVQRNWQERALIESEERFRLLAENAHDVIYRYRLAPELAMEYVSPSAARVFGYTPDEFYSDADLLVKIVHRQDRSTLRQLVLAKEDQGRSNVLRVIRKDGSQVWIEQSITPIFNDEGEIIALSGIARDITDRIQTQEALRLQSSALLAAANAIIITDRDGLALWVNPAFTRMTGFTPEEVIGKDLRILKSGKQDQAFYRHMWETIDAGEVWTGELINKRKDGSLYDEEMTITPVRDQTGEITHFVAIKSDITERKEAEKALAESQEQLYHAQKMEAIGRFAGGLAHDFNNLLTVVTGYSEYLLMRSLDPRDPIREDIQEICRAGERAADLTGQLLAFSRKQLLRPRHHNVNQIITDLSRMLRRVIGDDIELITDLDEELPQVVVDKGSFEQVIVNLAVNARDAMPSGGKLEIRTELIELPPQLSGEESQRAIQIVVSDSGMGIPPEIIDRVFEPFFTTKDLGKGTGLGLSTVYGIVKQSRGEIFVDSRIGKGTTFLIVFPAAGGEPSSSEEEVVRTVRTLQGDETVLVVEHEDSVRELTRRVLQSHGYTVLAAKSGGEALIIAEKAVAPIHLVLTDIVMPHIGGIELVQRLAAILPNMKAIYMSGYPEELLGEHGVPLSHTTLLNKPFAPEQLLTIVRQKLESNPGTREA